VTRILLTGAAGFAGSHCLRHLLLNTDAVIACPVTYAHKGHPDRIAHACAGIPDAAQRVSVFPCDLALPIAPAARLAIGEPDWIINYASASHVDRSIADPVPFTLNNTRLMLTLLDLARTLPRLAAFLHVSTDEVFGPADHGEMFGEDAPHRPSNPYSASKSIQSQLGAAWWRTYGVPFTELYCCNMLGEHQDSEKFVPLAMRKIAAGQPVPVHAGPDGIPGSRFWQHARNVADAALYILERQPPARYADGAATVPSRWCVTSGDRLTNLDLAREISAAMGIPLDWETVRADVGRPGHDLHYGLDGSRLAAAGWVPPVDFATAVKRTVARGILSSPE